ncbi:hypothetical protein BGX38DRAFT_1146570 [Terfezia claveryi]|nr:hypothetical protein BGX38DRAFT_1146570 [Terfezia claveryi]
MRDDMEGTLTLAWRDARIGHARMERTLVWRERPHGGIWRNTEARSQGRSHSLAWRDMEEHGGRSHWEARIGGTRTGMLALDHSRWDAHVGSHMNTGTLAYIEGYGPNKSHGILLGHT